MVTLKKNENVILCDKNGNRIIWSILNPYIFSDVKWRTCGWSMNLGAEYKNFLIFITVLIWSDEDCTTNLC